MRYLPLFFLLIPLLLRPAGATAQGSVTIAAGATVSGDNANLFVTGHWTHDGAFNAGNGAVVFSGPNNQTLTHNGTGAFNNLTVDKSGGDLVLASTLNVDGTLTLTSGDVDLNGQSLVLGPSATLNETAGSTVKGSAGNIEVTRTLNAPSSENVGGLGATITSSANLGSTTLRRGHAVQTGAGNESILRYYEILPANNSGLNATLAFAYDASELNGILESDLELFRSTDGGTTWSEEGGTVDETNDTVTLSGIEAFSRWTLGGATTPLPVELVSFEAVVDGAAVLLQWITASETNNAGFEIQSLSDLVPDWEGLGWIAGQGTTAEAQHYSYRVESRRAGRHLFRLKQIDFDGTFAYSPEVEVTVAVQGAFQLSPAYPNPFNPRTQITLAVARLQRMRVEVYDLMGRRVARLHDGLLAAHTAYRFVFEAADHASGVYVIRIAGEDFAASHVVTLVR